MPTLSAQLNKIALNKKLLWEIGRSAIEDELVEWRDTRRFTLGRNNGLTIHEKNGSSSSIIRFGPEHALKIGLLAIAQHLNK